jgi:hypothetical protein
MEIATEKAKNDEKLTNLVIYYLAFFDRLQAMEQQNSDLLKRSTSLFRMLAQKGDSLSNVNVLLTSMYLVGIF